jgi:hypothetical protein
MMRAKMQVNAVEQKETVLTLSLSAVTDKPFDAEGNSEDNSFSKWTPTATLVMTITNPNLFGKFKQGQKFYLDFTEATA